MSSRVIRKALLAAGVLLMPLGAITLAPVPAGALTLTPFTCSVGGSMSFDFGSGKGISKDGWASVSSIGGAKITYPTLGGCTGNGNVNSAAQGLHCDRKTPGQPASNPACQPGLRWGFNSWADFLGNVPPPPNPRHGEIGVSFADAIQRGVGSIHHPWNFVINGTSFAAKSKTVSLIPAGSLCGPSELGFQSMAHIFEPHHVSQTMTVTLCLGAITGAGLNPGDNFHDASIDQVGIVDSAVIDQASSTVHVG
jgi:hypothetical protein